MRRRMFLTTRTTPPEHYLRVYPSEVQWVTTTTPVEYEVYSDLSWIIQ